jgi:hypothetical protein
LGAVVPNGLFLQKLTKVTKGFPTPATQPGGRFTFVIFVPFCEMIFGVRQRSREFIQGDAGEGKLDNYIASADVTAFKPLEH